MLEKIGKMAQGAAQVITSEAQKQVSNVKMANLYEDLGRLVYANKDDMGSVADVASEIIAKIDAEESTKEQHAQTSTEAKAAIVKEKDALLGKVKCPCCGEAVPMNMSFCGFCGAEMPKPEKPVEEPAEEPVEETPVETVKEDEEGKDAEDNKEVKEKGTDADTENLKDEE